MIEYRPFAVGETAAGKGEIMRNQSTLKKLSLVLLSALLCTFLALTCIAWGNSVKSSAAEPDVHEHTYDGDVYVLYAPKCVVAGLGMQYCSDEGCRNSIIVSIPADGYTHEVGADGHCIHCGKKPSASFVAKDDEGADTGVPAEIDHYDVKKAEGGDETRLVVPETYNGKPVHVAENAFKDDTALTEVIIEGAPEIGSNAFDGCTNLEKLTLEEGIEKIGAEAFKGCTNLEEVELPAGVEYIGADAFAETAYIKDAKLEDYVLYNGPSNEYILKVTAEALVPKTAGASLFSLTDELGAFTVPDGTTVIAEKAFAGLEGLKKVNLPAEGLVSIGKNAFDGCTEFKSILLPAGIKGSIAGLNIAIKVYYNGAMPAKDVAWEYADELELVTVYYKSETEPVVDGHFWHDVDGVITEWPLLTDLVLEGYAETLYVGTDSDFTTGENFKVYAVYDGVKSKDPLAADKYTVDSSAVKMDTEGNYPVTVTYLFKTATYTVHVEVKTYTVTIVYDNGTQNGSATVRSDAPEYALPAAPTKTGYTFLGWQVGTDTELKAAGTKITVNADVTITAKWQVKTPAVTLVLGEGGTGATPEVSDLSEDNQYTVTVKGTPTRTGYRFMGWDVKLNGEAAELTEGKLVLDLADEMNVTITANWAKTYTFTLNGAENATVTYEPAELHADYITGEKVKFKVEAKAGYLLVSVKNGETALEAGADGFYTVEFADANITVTVTTSCTVSRAYNAQLNGNNLFVVFVESTYTKEELSSGLKLQLNGETKEFAPTTVEQPEGTFYKVAYTLTGIEGSASGTAYTLTLKMGTQTVKSENIVTESKFLQAKDGSTTYTLSKTEADTVLTVSVSAEKTVEFNDPDIYGDVFLHFFITFTGFDASSLTTDTVTLQIGTQSVKASQVNLIESAKYQLIFNLSSITTEVEKGALTLKIADVGDFPVKPGLGAWTKEFSTATYNYKLEGGETATLTITQKASEYTVTVNETAVEGNSYKLMNDTTEVHSGETVPAAATLKLTFTFAPNYTAKVSVDGATLNGSGTEYTISNITANVTITITYVDSSTVPAKKVTACMDAVAEGSGFYIVVMTENISAEEKDDLKTNFHLKMGSKTVSPITVIATDIAGKYKLEFNQVVDLELGKHAITAEAYGETFNDLTATAQKLGTLFLLQGRNYTLSVEETTLYITVSDPAAAEESYTVKFEAEGVDGYPTQETVTGSNTFDLSTKTPSKTGYTFLYWYYKTADEEARLDNGFAPKDFVTKDNDGSDTTITLYARFVQHNYPSVPDENGNLVCEDCGAILHSGKATSTKVKAPAATTKLDETGMSVSFWLVEAGNDWDAVGVWTNFGKFKISLPNIQANNQGTAVDSDETIAALRTKIGNGNALPSSAGASILNGAEWNSICASKNIYVTITIGPQAINFYKNGLQLFSYPATMAFPATENNGTMGDFIKAFLLSAQKEGVTVATPETAYNGSIEAEDVFVKYGKVYSAEEAKTLFTNYMTEKCAYPKHIHVYENGVCKLCHAPQSGKDVTEGTAQTTTWTSETGWNSKRYVEAGFAKGDKVVVYGTTSKGEVNDAWFSVVAELDTGTAATSYTMRTDNYGWYFDGKAVDKYNVAKMSELILADGTLGVVGDWALVKNIVAGCNWRVEFDWTGAKLVVTMNFTGTAENSGKNVTYVQKYFFEVDAETTFELHVGTDYGDPAAAEGPVNNPGSGSIDRVVDSKAGA